MKSMHDSGKKMEWKNNRKSTVSLFIHEVQSHIKGNKFHFGAFISKQVGVHQVQDVKLLDSKKCLRLIKISQPRMLKYSLTSEY